MSNVEMLRIADQLCRAVGGPAWHGPSVLEAVDGLSAAQAATRVVPRGHTIHELVRHITSWLEISRLRLAGTQPEVTEAMDWPATGDWAADTARLREAARELDAAIRATPDARLDQQIPIDGDRWSVYATLHGVIQHTLYHAGQIAILKKGAQS